MLIFVLLIVYSAYKSCEAGVITTSLGSINGNQIGSYQTFKKIPFAKPPIGKLRFQKPMAAEKWEGILNATGRNF